MSKRTRASLFAGIYVISSLFWGPWAEAAFHLERADNSQPTKGLNVPKTLLLADAHWPVYQDPPKPRPVKVQPAVYRPSGDVWSRLADCESGGRPGTNTGNGYYGMYQFLPSTWRSVGGSGMPHHASAAEQTKRAQIAVERGGWGQFPACARKLGMR